jgi:PAS domain S-box-containing protein
MRGLFTQIEELLTYISVSAPTRSGRPGGHGVNERVEFAESLVGTALLAVTRQGSDQLGNDLLAEALDSLPAAIYVTDQTGAITYYNRACIGLAGRTPSLRHDRWCVTWRLYTCDGEPLPHAECPMAIAIREQRPIRNVEAIAERPDGSRVQFMPFPTPYFGADGNLAGAINLLLDVTEERQVETLRTQAARCRRLAAAIGDRQAVDALTAMAGEYEAQAWLIGTPN